MTMTDFGNAIADAVTDAVDRLRDETVDGELVRSVDEWAKRNGIEVSDRGKLRADVVEAYERDCRTWLEAEHQHRAEQVACNLKFQAVNDNILNLAGQPGMSVFMLGWEAADIPNRDGFTVENIDLAIEFLTALRNRVARGGYSSVGTA